ncbi:MAG: tRNA dimethylallyltransferase [Candidatus Paceibacteria bacterium]|jgi:tRNA dimethylallyltransferase
MANKPKIIAIVGPTAAGKTSLSITIAKHVHGEVISADSRQVYEGMDIGTSKVTEAEMDGVSHHLLDIAKPMEVYTAADFTRDANRAIADITSRGKTPIIAGGTFFYLDLLRGKMQAAPVEPDQELRTKLEKYSNEELLQLLETKDARRASAVDPHNRRRLIRSLEIIETLGSVPPVVPVESDYDWLIFGVTREKEELRERFRTRAALWLTDGFQNEVERLLEEGVTRARFQEMGFEYTLMLQLIDKELTETEFVDRFEEKNWQYAKRQLTWLRKDNSIIWVEPSDTDSILESVDNFLENK